MENRGPQDAGLSQKNCEYRDPIVWSISALPCPWDISRNTLPFQQKTPHGRNSSLSLWSLFMTTSSWYFCEKRSTKDSNSLSFSVFTKNNMDAITWRKKTSARIHTYRSQIKIDSQKNIEPITYIRKPVFLGGFKFSQPLCVLLFFASGRCFFCLFLMWAISVDATEIPAVN